jgi:anti-sigma regulatory factor (Ser/Thr protein kinase)
MPPLDLVLPYRLNGANLRSVVQDFIKGCQDRLPNGVSIDFGRLGFVEPAGVTFLSNFIWWLHHRGIRVYFQGHQRQAEAISFLDDSLFFEQHCGAKLNPAARVRATTRPLVQARHEQSQAEIRGQFIPWLASSLGVPLSALREIQVNLLELFNNIQDHSSLEIGCLFAQHFPNLNGGRVAIAVADFGIGIPSAVRRVNSDLDDNAAIIKAVQRGFTSGQKPRNMGEGLSLLLDTVVGQNGGSVTIYSLTGAVAFNAFQGAIHSTPLQQVGFCPAGLSHLGMSELGQQLCEEGVVPSGLFELAFHGTL